MKDSYIVYMPNIERDFVVHENTGAEVLIAGFPEGLQVMLQNEGGIVWNWMVIWGREKVPFGKNLYRHEVGHILQQAVAGGLFTYRALAISAYVGAYFDHDNWFERQAQCYGGFSTGHTPPRDE